MNIKAVALGAFTSLIVTVTPQAQGLLMPWLDDIPPLSDQDRAIIRDTVQRYIHGKPRGTVANWANPAAGGHRGRITLLSTSATQGMPCEQIEYLILEPGTTKEHGRYVFNSCRVSDGTWKLAQ